MRRLLLLAFRVERQKGHVLTDLRTSSVENLCCKNIWRNLQILFRAFVRRFSVPSLCSGLHKKLRAWFFKKRTLQSDSNIFASSSTNVERLIPLFWYWKKAWVQRVLVFSLYPRPVLCKTPIPLRLKNIERHAFPRNKLCRFFQMFSQGLLRIPSVWCSEVLLPLCSKRIPFLYIPSVWCSEDFRGFTTILR